MLNKALSSLLSIALFFVGMVVLYMVNLSLTMLLSFVWEKLLGYNLFMPSSALAVPAVYVTTIVSVLLVAWFLWNKSKALVWGAIIGAIPLIFMNTFA